MSSLNKKINFSLVARKFDEYVQRGFSMGIGRRSGRMCVEAAICAALGEPHSDRPTCVNHNVRVFKIALNDKPWSSSEARAKGLRDLGIAQLGSDTLNGNEFDNLLTSKLNREFKAEITAYFRRMCYTTKKAVRIGSSHSIFWVLPFSERGSVKNDQFLQRIANCALQTLKILESPGVKYL